MSRLSDVLRKANTEKLGVRDISRRAEQLGMKLSPSNVSNYLRGNHPEDPPQQTLEAFAKALDVPLEDLETAARYTGRDPFEAHPSSDLLTPPQRTAVNEIIRLLAESNKGAAHDRQGDTQQGPEAGSTVDGSEDRREDGSEARRRQTPMSAEEQQAELDNRPVKDLLGLAADKERKPKR